MKRLLVALLSMAPSFVFAHDYSIDDLVIMHPVAKETTDTARTSAGYLVITNNGETTDYLVAVEANFPRVMMHGVKVEDGIASMKHLERVALDPGSTVTFEPGGNHVMFMGLSEPMVEGEKVPAVLVFENAGRIEIKFNIEDIADENYADHSNH